MVSYTSCAKEIRPIIGELNKFNEMELLDFTLKVFKEDLKLKNAVKKIYYKYVENGRDYRKST
ncbi:hypothetical protein AGMMS49573_10610 [Endomicrobiia bacterium]|nr:hypothetical protein AGMMS49573_10610 [Endomicrobiia bacterium]